MNLKLIEYVVIIHLFINIISFFMFLVDKLKAIDHKWRISEKQLLLFLVLGPYGGLYAMKLFRHKTRKKRFVVTGITFCILTSIIYLLYFVINIHYPELFTNLSLILLEPLIQ